MIKIRQRNNQAGFTLLELLMAMAILATISVFGITIIGNQIDSRNRATKMNNAQHAIHQAMSKVYDDLRHAYIIPKADINNSNVLDRIVKPSLIARPAQNLVMFSVQNFQSVLPSSPQSNLAFIAYQLKKTEGVSEKKQLIRRVDTDFKESMEHDNVGDTTVLLEDVKDFKIIFWDGGDFSREDWDSLNADTRDSLPKMAQIKLSVYLPDLRDAQLVTETIDESKRQTLSFESIVYLMYSKGQKDIKEPAKEYRWR